MRSKTLRLMAVILLATCLFSITTSAQVRRRSPRSAAPRQRRAPLLVPLTAEQKEAVADLISKAKEVDYNYKFQKSEFLWSNADGIFDQAHKVADLLPEGISRV